MNFKVKLMLICLSINSFSFYTHTMFMIDDSIEEMEEVEKIVGLEEIGSKLVQVIEEWSDYLELGKLIGESFLGIEHYKSEPALFPLEGTSIESFEELFLAAYEGNTAVVKTFCERHLAHKGYVDSKGYTLSMMAAAGYIAGKDSWDTFAYLVGLEVPFNNEHNLKKPEDKVNNDFLWWLRNSLKDESQNIRRREVLNVLRQKKEFVSTQEKPYFLVSSVPPKIVVKRKEDKSEQLLLQQIAVCSAVGMLLGYFKTGSQTNAHEGKTFLRASSPKTKTEKVPKKTEIKARNESNDLIVSY